MAWTVAAKLSDLSEDSAFAVELGKTSVALYLVEGEVYATSNICTHEFALLSDGFVEDGFVECPLHQARFDIISGRALCAPANEPIATYPAKVENGVVLVDIQ
ncbi:MAG: non-heme iron oxygenase ferredoxin subunit [Acidisphaera sp.]|nr:non-heme iron oxygenase ferredoxin subunit [Acidisphaera sp.]